VSEIAVTRLGTGPEVLLVHGGASPRRTWGALRALSARWTLLLVHRRGFPPSPPGKKDFDVGAADIVPLLAARPHVVAHSYGALGTLIAASRRPQDVRSLTIIEPPLSHLLPNDPEAMRLQELGDAVLIHGLDADPAMLREFLRIAGGPSLELGEPLPPRLADAVGRSQGGRLPSEAHLQLELVREAGVPSLVASGDHSVAVERVCDALAERLDARRLIASGAGHFVAAAAGFAEQLERHMASAG
jgi:pimeloyl-ACP methyl ester carboxylesterase